MLGGVGCRRLDLGELEAQQVEVALARALALAQLRQLALDSADASAWAAAVCVAQLEVLGAGEAVEDLELGGGERQLAVLVLAVEGEQPRAERPQVGRRRGAPADEGAGAARGADPAAEDDLVGALGQPLGDLGQLGVVEQAVGKLEHALDPGLLGARAGRSAAAPGRPSAGRASARAPSCRPRSRR